MPDGVLPATMRGSVKRNIAALAALGALLLGLGAPLTALDPHCPMQPPGASLCAVCDIGGATGQGAQVSAGSCCKFEPANPAPRTPGVAPAIQKGGPAQVLDGALPWSDSHGGMMLSEGARSAPFQNRSTRTPLILGTTLRL